MKWNVRFTRGEWVAALALLALMLAGYLFYALYDRPRPVADTAKPTSTWPLYILRTFLAVFFITTFSPMVT